MVGVAHTLRYVPMREDLRSQLAGGQNAQRRAIEGLQPDEVLVIEARGEPDAGTIGDIFAMRALQLGAAGVVTDGALRDTPAIRRLDIPVYHGSSHAATLAGSTSRSTTRCRSRARRHGDARRRHRRRRGGRRW